MIITPSTRMVFAREYELIPGINGPACRRDTAAAIGGYRRRAHELLAAHPDAVLVRVLNRVSDSRVRYTVESADEIIYVPSTYGRYGKSAVVRCGKEVRRITD